MIASPYEKRPVKKPAAAAKQKRKARRRKPRRREWTCRCGRRSTIKIKGLCRGCYLKQWRQKNYEKHRIESHIHYMRNNAWRPRGTGRHLKAEYVCTGCHETKKGLRFLIDELPYCQLCKNKQKAEQQVITMSRSCDMSS